MDDPLLQGAVETFGDPVRLGFLHESVVGLNPPEARLVDEMVGKVLRRMVHEQSQPAGHPGFQGSVDTLKPLADWFQGRVPVASLTGVPAHALPVPVLHRREQPDPAILHRQDADAVCAPHLVRSLGHDFALLRVAGACRLRRGESRLCSRMSRKTRFRATRIPRWTRSRAHTLRCPSPENGEPAKSARISSPLHQGRGLTSWLEA